MPELMYDQFKIISKNAMNNDDITSLTKLYLPLMGIDSYSLYLGLSTLETNTSYNFKVLIDILNFRSIKSINTALSKLEGLGLIEVYINEKKDYLYELIKPLTINEFLKEEVLKNLLISQIGENEVKKLEKEITKNTRGYKKVTKKFSEVFEIQDSKPIDIIHKIVSNDIEIVNDDFNYSLFKMQFDTQFISEEALEQADLKNNIIRISFYYKLDEKQMKDVIIRCLDIDKNLDYASISKNARIEYGKTKNAEALHISTKEKDDYLSSIKDDKTLALCNWLENVSPSEVLESLSGIKASTAEIKLFETLTNNSKLPVSVINFMILIVNEEKGGEIPGYNYFEKIANTWSRAKIKNIPDVIRFLEKKNKETTNTKKTYYKKEEKLPEWYGDYTKELDKKLEDNKELNQEEVSKILDQAKDLFGE